MARACPSLRRLTVPPQARSVARLLFSVNARNGSADVPNRAAVESTVMRSSGHMTGCGGEASGAPLFEIC